MIRNELGDLNVIWIRFLEERSRLLGISTRMVSLADRGRLNSTEYNRLAKMERHLLDRLKVDAKSLFLFADVLLTKCILAVKVLSGKRQGVRYKSFNTFLDSLEFLAADDSLESRIYERIRDISGRVESLLGFYRDKFLVHPARPYGEGIVVGVNHQRYQLSSQVYTRQRQLLPEVEMKLKVVMGDRLSAQRGSRAMADIVMENLHMIKDRELRGRAETFVRAAGVLSPNLYNVFRDVAQVVRVILEELGIEVDHAARA